MDAKNNKPPIVLVEDDEILSELIAICLESKGYQVVRSEDGNAGFQVINELHPNLIILDLMLPGINGFELCRRIKGSPELQNASVLMLSALAQRQDIQKGISCGADAYITKPFEKEKLLEQAEKLLQRSA